MHPEICVTCHIVIFTILGHQQCVVVNFVCSCSGLGILYKSILREVGAYSWPPLRCQHPNCTVPQIQLRSDKENVPKQSHIFPWELRKRAPVKWYTPHSRGIQNNIILRWKQKPLWFGPYFPERSSFWLVTWSPMRSSFWLVPSSPERSTTRHYPRWHVHHKTTLHVGVHTLDCE